MLLLHQPPEATTLIPLRASRRRRLNDSSTLHIYQTILQTPEIKMPSKITPTPVHALPAEILFKILSYLPSSDLARAARCCRKWYHACNDPLLWRDLNLSGMRAAYAKSILPRSLESRLAQCRSLYTDRPPWVAHDVLCRILKHTSQSKALTKVTLSAYPQKSTLPFLSFFRTCAGKLTHINLARTFVPTYLIGVIIERHADTLTWLDVEFSAVNDNALMIIAKEAKVLKHLGIGGCLSVTREGLRKFLTRDLPESIESLDLRWLMDITFTWVEEMIRKHRNISKLDLRGCDKLSVVDICDLQNHWPEVKIRTAKLEQSTLGYMRYMQRIGGLQGGVVF